MNAPFGITRLLKRRKTTGLVILCATKNLGFTTSSDPSPDFIQDDPVKYFIQQPGKEKTIYRSYEISYYAALLRGSCVNLSCRFNHNTLHHSVILALVILLGIISGCATVEKPPSLPLPAPSTGRFLDIQKSYAPTGEETLALRKLPVNSSDAVSPFVSSADVYIIVHPGYGIFFQNLLRDKHAESKYILLNKQFENETAFISSKAASGATIILILPGNFETESVAPQSFISYLNRTAGPGPSVFYMTTKSSSSGNIAKDDMINLVTFLYNVKAERVMVGGGYIGRCQKEFHNELTSFLPKLVYIVPEISTISPEDISALKATTIFESIQQQNYTLVNQFIDRRSGNASTNILSILPPQN